MLPGTPETWEKYSSYARLPIIFVFVDFLSKNSAFVSERDWAMPKTLTVYYCFHNYPLSKPRAAGSNYILNLNILMGALRTTPAKLAWNFKYFLETLQEF